MQVANKIDQLGWLVADHVTAILAYWDRDQVCRFANSAYREWFGKTPDEMIGKITLKELLGTPLYEKNLPFITGALLGTKQVFEREIPLSAGGTRHSIATYYPDIEEGNVRGFFVHVADVTPIKLLEAKLLELERSKNREVLRSIIDTRENEREFVAIELRDSISQSLAYCKMMLENENNKEPGNIFLADITGNIHKAIHELNVLSNNLSPSAILHFGLKPAIEDYISNFQNQNNCTILFKCEKNEIEELAVNYKVSVYRIVQDFLLLLKNNSSHRKISIVIDHDPSGLVLHFSHDDVKFEIPRQSREYRDIQYRVEYCEGSLEEHKESNEYSLLIRLSLKGTKDR